jgi:hypothetical protein
LGLAEKIKKLNVKIPNKCRKKPATCKIFNKTDEFGVSSSKIALF